MAPPIMGTTGHTIDQPRYGSGGSEEVGPSGPPAEPRVLEIKGYMKQVMTSTGVRRPALSPPLATVELVRTGTGKRKSIKPTPNSAFPAASQSHGQQGQVIVTKHQTIPGRPGSSGGSLPATSHRRRPNRARATWTQPTTQRRKGCTCFLPGSSPEAWKRRMGASDLCPLR